MKSFLRYFLIVIIAFGVGYAVGQQSPRSMLLPNSSFTEAQDFVQAHGTWVIAEDLQQGIPYQTSYITCIREWDHCIDSNASVEKTSQNAQYLSAHAELYEIESWTPTEIVTKPNQSGCVQYVLRLDRANKHVSGIRTTTKTDGTCAGADLRNLTLQLLSGDDALARHRSK
jgi:hypothetical protein